MVLLVKGCHRKAEMTHVTRNKEDRLLPSAVQALGRIPLVELSPA
jgi:hypothetical protein